MITTTTNALLQFAPEDGGSLFGYEAVYQAWLDCRKNKRNSPASIQFELNLEENLLQLSEELSANKWYPSPSICFVADNGKPREIFAASFKDRIVHHLLVSALRSNWEKVFIYDSYSCRKGKGTHSAIERMRSFLKKITNNGTCKAYYLQMDIRAFFNSIDKVRLSEILNRRLNNSNLAWLVKTILESDPTDKAVFACSRLKWKSVENRKSLFNTLPSKGMPIGNLTSQFFANVYLNSLDQFVKHSLKAKYYVRYVDDFVIVHKNRNLLLNWRRQIEEFLHKELLLQCKQKGSYVRSVSSGVNFLGYITKVTHVLLRRRTLFRLNEKMEDFNKKIKSFDKGVQCMIIDKLTLQKLQSTLSSYWGMFCHDCSKVKMLEIIAQHRFLNLFFDLSDFPFKSICLPVRELDTFRKQYAYFRKIYNGLLVFQIGCYYEFFNESAIWAYRNLGLSLIAPRYGFKYRCGVPLFKKKWLESMLGGKKTVMIEETGIVTAKANERMATRFFIPAGVDCQELLAI